MWPFRKTQQTTEADREAEDWILAMQQITSFIDEHDEMHAEKYRQDLLKFFRTHLAWMNRYHLRPEKKLLREIKMVLMSLEKLGGESLGGAIIIDESGKMSVEFLEDGVSAEAPDEIGKTMLAIKYILDSE